MRSLLISVLALWSFNAHAGLSVMPSFVSFGSVKVNGIQSSRNATIYNFGTDEQSLSFMGTCPFDFNVTHYSCFGMLKANQSCSVNITFNPSKVGPQSCTIYVNGKTSFQSISISGTGVEY